MSISSIHRSLVRRWRFVVALVVVSIVDGAAIIAADHSALAELVSKSAVEWRQPVRGEGAFQFMLAAVRTDQVLMSHISKEARGHCLSETTLEGAVMRSAPREREQLCQLALLTTGLSCLRIACIAAHGEWGPMRGTSSENTCILK